MGRTEAILRNDQTIASLVDDILDHDRNYRANLLTGKAMIVACFCSIAMKMTYSGTLPGLDIEDGWIIM